MKSFNSIFLFLLAVLLFMMGSCVSSKKVIYMNDISDSTSGKLGLSKINFDNPIQKNDQLQILVTGTNLQDLPVFNNGGQALMQNTGGASPGALGYLVESDGKIELPYLGRVQAEGLTRLALQDTLAHLLRDYTRNPVVTIKFLNYYISLLGEVSRPGRYNMPNERLTILEAIALAGDIQIFGRSNNVMIIREDSGQRHYGRINLLQSDLFRSPYFYLKTNDVVYVEPLPARFISRNGVPQYLGIVAVGLSLVLTTINLIAK